MWIHLDITGYKLSPGYACIILWEKTCIYSDVIKLMMQVIIVNGVKHSLYVLSLESAFFIIVLEYTLKCM